MKIPKLKFSLPKLALPKISLPKISLPKISLPKLPLPKLPLPKFLKKKAKVEDEAELEAEVELAAVAVEPPPLEDDEPGEDKPKGKGVLPKLKGKARVLVPVAGVVLLAGLGGGGYFAWRMVKGAPEVVAQSEAGRPAAPEAGRKAEAEGAKPEGQPQSVEAHGEKAAEGGHEGGGGGGEKVAIVPLPPLPPPSEIEIMVRHLQDLQEQVSAGDSAAFKEMPKHLRKLGRAIFDAPPETWEKKENTQALISYLLRGGNPEAGRKALAGPKFFGRDAPIAKAAIAYLENVEGPDRDFMLTLDPLALDPTLGPSVAFVQSILLSRDRAAAIAKLDVARLLAPGGLVEEAALRREVGLLAEDRQYERFAALGRQYWARFRASPYAENFLRQFMLGVARVALSIKLEEWSQLDGFVESLTPETKRNIYLTVAQNASVVGNVDLATMAAGRARELSAVDSAERQRATVYGALAAVGAADSARSGHLLDGVDRAQLPPGDQPLYDAAAYVSGRVFRPPARGFKDKPAGDANTTDADLERAEKLLKDGDAVIASARKTMAREK
ncbi:hypothetical protein CCR94_05815 [Rhodoblastus sphagnicola]|uniref:Chemotaxis protein n=1 Tax=Rhodoblastus sphagnicola TaxID=333368 RepID=A0A2S6NCH5_9HYPH|nr:hypothetical protein [Rhodoblastus sphagnicola]MBB4199347.1 chemotaxis protein MotC [Rhodoblastus sphagnicola]PPQ32325.1 hypothetical protein CCR94_05815 [Rhodoblastus sphagnicola]